MSGHVVVVGASLAGLRTVQALRRQGHAGPVTVIGDEPGPPYDRPPLSKQLLLGTLAPADLDLPVPAGLDAAWLTGVPAVALDRPGRSVRLADGRAVHYDQLVIATGSRARPWSGAGARALTLRTRADGLELAAVLDRAASLLVLGAGFLGSEVAAAACARGVAVVLVEPQALPLQSVLGPTVGRWVASLHRGAGVDLRLGTGARELLPGPVGTAAGALLTDGTQVRADAVLAALGAVPSTEWLAASGLQIDGGVVCDAWCRPLQQDGRPAPDLVVVGDVARWPHPFADGPVTLGHWTHAGDQADAAVGTLLHGGNAPAYVPVPSFWSDLYGHRLRSVGLPHLADSSHVAETHANGEPAVVRYLQAGRVVGAVTLDRTSRLAGLRGELQQRLDREQTAA